jgi:hypothetical protein
LKRGHPQSGSIAGQPDVMQRVIAVD